MTVTLYGASLSPYVRKVRILLAEFGITYEHKFIPPRGQPDW
ncbi:MAG TPA: glutathione S-transferase family protein, partial [Pseudomonas sp.]|nr:glutathione S-transferase family protein [Pseudomonas sp.]